MAKKAPPFDPLQAAVDVKGGKMKLSTLTPEQQSAVRYELSHTGRLQTKLLRRANGTKEATPPPPTSRFGHAYSS